MNTLFLAAEATKGASSFMPVAIQLVIAIGFTAIIMIASALLGPKRRTSDKLANFESGIPAIGNARQPMAVKYFLVAILFVLFDVEVIFMYPWAVNFRDLGAEGLIEMFIFMGTLLAGFFYIIKKGALNWD